MSVPELLPKRAMQARTMTIAAGPGVSPVEAGHWYSPAAVEEFLANAFSDLVNRVEPNSVHFKAWERVCSALDDVVPYWPRLGPTAMDAAPAVIRHLAEQAKNSVPNLDALDETDLLTEQLALEDLTAYAHHKRMAIVNRKAGHIEVALKQEKWCDEIYKRLPEKYRW